MADTEQPEQPDQPASPRRGYVNWAHAHASPMEFVLTLGYKEGEAPATAVAPLILSWEFVPILIQFLQTQLDVYQAQVGPVRDITAVAGIEENAS